MFIFSLFGGRDTRNRNFDGKMARIARDWGTQLVNPSFLKFQIRSGCLPQRNRTEMDAIELLCTDE